MLIGGWNDCKNYELDKNYSQQCMDEKPSQLLVAGLEPTKLNTSTALPCFSAW